jgi:hypothetical protein
MVELDKEYNDNLSHKLQEEEDEYVKDQIHQIMHPTDPNSSKAEESQGESAPVSRSQTPLITHPYARMDEEQKDFY